MTEAGTRYNLISGQSRERLQALADGVFAVAMTLLVLDVRLPESVEAGSNGELWSQLAHLGPQFAAYLLSFTMLGTFWLAQHALLLAVGVYWLNLLALGLALEWQLQHAWRAGLTDSVDRLRLVRRRLVSAQILYALCALVALVNPVASIVALAAAPLLFIVSPRLPIRW